MAYSTRNTDKVIEKEIAKFCDKHIFCNDIQFKRCHDDALQKQGIDGYLTIESLGIHNAPADEKAGAHYVNQPIRTYLMELSQIKTTGEEVDGWFLSGDNKTEYYILMYLWALVPQTIDRNGKADVMWEEIKEDNITLVEYYIVKKSDIFKYLEECGFDKQRLRDGVKYLREHPEKDFVKTKFGFKFVISRFRIDFRSIDQSYFR